MSDSINKDATFSLKAVINKQKNKVLFAVIDSDFADVLLSFLTLPLGTIVRVLENHYRDEPPVLGSLTSLYRGLSNLDIAYFSEKGCKHMLLNPSTSFIDECGKLKLDIGDSQTIKYFGCGEFECVFAGNPIAGMYHGSASCRCGRALKHSLGIRDERDVYRPPDGVFTKFKSTFLISDDLELLPNETTSVTQIIRNLGLIDIDGTECRNVTFGFNEVMDLLKWSLLSSTPLTDIILKKRMYFAAFRFWIEKFWTESKIGTPADATVPLIKVEKIETPPDAALTVKVVFQKSTNKLVFVEADEDFVEFLFSLLTIPLGKVEYLLGGNTNLKKIDNLYRSITSPINSKYLKKLEIARLINPTVPHGYLSKFRMFHIVEEGPPKLYYNTVTSPILERYLSPVSPYPLRSSMNLSFKSPSAEGNYVKSPSKYMVKDDLTVTPVCMASYISTITEQKIPLSDVGELVVKIGLQEASSILKASLSSTRALSNALSHLLLKKPKLKH